MADRTAIEWTDATWNPITGCSVVSAGCKHCYAMKLAGTRLKHVASRKGLTVDTKAGPVWTGEVRFNAAELLHPLSWRRARMIFVCAHGDLFHENVPDDWIDRVFAVMALAPQHTFQVLTKRPERMRAYLKRNRRRARTNAIRAIEPRECQPRTNALMAISRIDPDAPIHQPLPNVWLGVSVEDQPAADERIPIVLDTPAALRWISAEPLLGPLVLHPSWLPCQRCQGRGWYLERLIDDHQTACADCLALARAGGLTFAKGQYAVPGPRLGWVVGGFESGRNARPGNFDDARSLRDQCAAAGAPFLWKQNGEYLPADPDMPSETQESEEIAGRLHWPMHRVGKKAAGRLLDGVEHDAFPTTSYGVTP